MLKIKNVTKTFGDIVALEDISFDVKGGEFVFITGPSGSGKTTLLRLILRELLPDKGEIFLDEHDIIKLKRSEIPQLRQKIGVVFQDFKVLPEKTLRENVEIALAVIGLSKPDWKARVDHVLGLVDLKDRSELFPSQLSGGELQRASLARALVVNPELILADEPTGNLDWETSEHLMDLFKKINEEGKTIIMATHHKLIIDKLGKRVVNLSRSRRKSKEEEEISSQKTQKKPQKDHSEETSEKDSKEKSKSKRVKVKVEEV